MEMKFTTIGLIGLAAGALASYFNSPEIAQAGELVRLAAAGGIGVGTGLASYFGARVSAELFGSRGLPQFFTAIAAAAGLGYGGYAVSDIIAGNIITEMAEADQQEGAVIAPVRETGGALIAYTPETGGSYQLSLG